MKLRESIPVYDLSTKSENHNFALKNGVIVHNCGGSKDIADSLCGAVFNAYSNLDLASEPKVSEYTAKSQTRLLEMAGKEDNPTKEFLKSRAINMFK